MKLCWSCRRTYLEAARIWARDSVKLAGRYSTSTRHGTAAVSPRDKRRIRVDKEPLPCLEPTQVMAALNHVFSKQELANLRQEVRFLRDPKQLAAAVATHLRKGRLDRAFELAKLGTARTRNPSDAVVAWNHVLEVVARSAPARTAFKLYNQMKKHRVQPSGLTHTVLLRGLAEGSPDHSAVKIAQSVLNQLGKSDSSLEKDIIHVNAALDVCVNAGAMDEFWSLVSELEADRKLSADSVTYSIIFKGLARDYDEQVTGKDRKQETSDRLLAILTDARAIWAEIYGRWTSGTLQVDESTLCSYLRLLHRSTAENTSLEILQVVAACGGPSMNPKQSGHAHTAAKEVKEDGHAAELPSDVMYPLSRDTIAPTVDVAGKVEASSRGARRIPLRNNTLSIVLAALASVDSRRLVHVRSAESYWDAFVDIFRIVPDRDNSKAILRLCIVRGDSMLAAKVIRQRAKRPPQAPSRLPDQRHTGNTLSQDEFLLAMTACAKEARAERLRGRTADANRETTANRRAQDGQTLSTPQSCGQAILHLLESSGIVAPGAVVKYISCFLNTESAAQVLVAIDGATRLLSCFASRLETSNANGGDTRTRTVGNTKIPETVHDTLAALTWVIELSKTLVNTQKIVEPVTSSPSSVMSTDVSAGNVLETAIRTESDLRASFDLSEKAQPDPGDLESLKAFSKAIRSSDMQAQHVRLKDISVNSNTTSKGAKRRGHHYGHRPAGPIDQSGRRQRASSTV